MKKFVLILSLLMLAFGCANKNPAPGEEINYNLFFSPADHVSGLLQAGQVDRAMKTYGAQLAYFRENAEDADVSALAGELCRAACGKYVPSAERTRDALESIRWPAPVAGWPRIRNILDTADEQNSFFASQAVFKSPDCAPAVINELSTALDRTKKKIRDSAAREFLAYPVFTEKNFFTAYPLRLDAGRVLEKAGPELDEKIGRSSAKGVAHFAKTYKAQLDEGLEKRLASRYFACSLGCDPKDAGLKQILDAVRLTRQAGLEPPRLDDLKVVMVQATSPTLAREKYLEFPIGINVDLPFATKKAAIGKVFSSKTLGRGDIIILVNVAVAKISRDISGLNSVESTYVSGTKTVANPKHQELAELKKQITNQSQLHSAQSYNAVIAYGLIGAISHSVEQNDIDSRLEEVSKKLAQTPKTIAEQEMSKYRFNTADMDVLKEATVHYYIIDNRKKTLFSSTFDLKQERSFTVAYRLKKSDINRAKYLNQMDQEADVQRFEKDPASVDLSTLLDQYLKGNGKTAKFKSMAQVRKKVLDQRNQAIALFQSESFDARPVDDNRFESVVVVFHPDGKLGSGFFVRDDLVLTNYHVIQGVKYVEMTMYGGQETFGKVVATDPKRDLALVKVQARGKPVKFLKSRTLPIGATVEAIGHPMGMEFSITRGVVSAIRKLDSSFVPGGKQILFIQTDTPINPGNSGGPLFLGDKVIGLNNQKLAATPLEGLGFAIHYSEAEKFLRKHGVTYLEK